MIRTLLFLILLYLIFRVITRMLLPSTSRKRQSFFFSNHGPFQSNGPAGSNSNAQKGADAMDHIEEAEFEDITEEEEEPSESQSGKNQ